MLRSAVLAAFVLAQFTFFASLAAADQTDSRLDGHFSRLHSTSDLEEGRRVTRQIRIIWRQTENEVANNAMANAGWMLYNKQYERRSSYSIVRSPPIPGSQKHGAGGRRFFMFSETIPRRWRISNAPWH